MRLETVHGYPIIERKRLNGDNEYEVVIVARAHEYHPLCVWVMNIQTGLCNDGGYYANYQGAKSCFNNRYR